MDLSSVATAATRPQQNHLLIRSQWIIIAPFLPVLHALQRKQINNNRMHRNQISKLNNWTHGWQYFFFVFFVVVVVVSSYALVPTSVYILMYVCSWMYVYVWLYMCVGLFVFSLTFFFSHFHHKNHCELIVMFYAPMNCIIACYY